jgi:NAD(P)-dependent dehydrogenase (short-subunit alcohol dehydrogenase family)/NADPH-dependent 2,4-dienoyl-CoA reductase/sulfur reductase-like enzyme/nitrite reductase/ring-hydroxylating ferredoxin subunit
MDDDSERMRDFGSGLAAAECPEGSTVAGRLGDQTVLLTRRDGVLGAIGGTCTHLGAPLHKGACVDGQIRCPLHHARFDARTGEAIGAPAFDPLPRYEVHEDAGTIRVGAKLEPAVTARTAMRPESPIVIVGAGAAGHACADLLARHGHGAAVTLLEADSEATYDRTFCPKQYLAGAKPRDDAQLPPPGQGRSTVTLRRNAEVAAIDTARHELQLANGERVGYATLVLATGAAPVAPDFEGANRPNVYSLRTLADADAIIAAAGPAKSAAIIGASFIALETAASMIARKLDVTVVAPDEVPLGSKLGKEVGQFVQKLHEKKGVNFRLKRKAARYDGQTLTLDDGSTLAADFVVAGTGVAPRLDLARRAGLKIASKDEGAGVLVDEHLQTSAPGIYAIGDIASYPEARLKKRIRVEHWVHSQRQGQFVARLLMGAAQRYTDTPFFWSAHYDKSLRYIGRGSPEHYQIEGSVDDGDFTVRYGGEGNAAQALTTCGRDFEALRQAALWEGRDADAISKIQPIKDEEMNLDIEGKVALVTGADSGMGFETARMLLQEGVRVAISDQAADALATSVDKLRQHGEVIGIAADVTKIDDVRRLFAEVRDRLSAPDIVVNAAGVTGATGDFLEVDDAGWLKTLDINLMGAVRVCREAIPAMRDKRWGRIVLLGSEDGVQPYVDELAYCASKAGIINLAKGLSKAYGGDNVLVNTVSPAFIATPMTDKMMHKRAKERGTSFDQAIDSFLDEERPGMVLHRRGRADEVAAAILFLCSQRASFITGTNMRVDSGSVATV